MLPCSRCKNKFPKEDLDFWNRCFPCFEIEAEISASGGRRATFVTMELQTTGSTRETITRAHYNDILSRRVLPDGTVTRRPERRFI